MFYVYILQSAKDKKLYIGFSEIGDGSLLLPVPFDTGHGAGIWRF